MAAVRKPSPVDRMGLQGTPRPEGSVTVPKVDVYFRSLASSAQVLQLNSITVPALCDNIKKSGYATLFFTLIFIFYITQIFVYLGQVTI